MSFQISAQHIKVPESPIYVHVIIAYDMKTIGGNCRQFRTYFTSEPTPHLARKIKQGCMKIKGMISSFSVEEHVSSLVSKSCWKVLRLLSDAIKKHEKPVDFCTLRLGTNEAVEVNRVVDPSPASHIVAFILNPESNSLNRLENNMDAVYTVKGLIHIEESKPATIPEEAKLLLRLYAPYCFAALHARRWRRAFSISHFAQSLDGRIEAISHDQKWIGCPENLIHSHRMRALCDGIIIGSITLKRDKPLLSVRKVPGRNPTRIIIGSSVDNQDIDHLMQVSK
jgi:hypothetical protein